MHPRLTSVAIPINDIARRVVARALKQFDDGPDHDPGEVVPARLRLGESTGGFARDASRADEAAGQAGEAAGAEPGRLMTALRHGVTRSTGSATGRATRRRLWSAARRGPWRSWSAT